MNKRIKKKFQKRNGYRHYQKYALFAAFLKYAFKCGTIERTDTGFTLTVALPTVVNSFPVDITVGPGRPLTEDEMVNGVDFVISGNGTLMDTPVEKHSKRSEV